MRYRRFAPVIALLLMLIVACDININVGDGDAIEGSGDLVTETYDFSGFTAVELSHTFDATIRGSDVFAVSITFDDNLRDLLEIELRGSTLFLGLESGTSTRRVTLEATIAMPALESLELSGASRAEIAVLEPLTELELRASGASRIEGDIDTPRLDAELSGASSMRLDGYAADATLEASGASSFDLFDLEIERAELDLSGASSAELFVSDELGPVDVDGASRLRYDGSPMLHDVSTSSGSSVDAR